MLKINGLAHRYGANYAIRDVTLTLSQGVTALLGPNGAGKSTLMKLLSTLEPVREGEIHWDGEQLLSRSSIMSYRSGLGVLPQHFGFLPGMKVRDLLMYMAWLRRIPERDARKATLTALDAVGLSDKSHERMKKLSGGMQQRVGIASAIMSNPRIVILDEPTVGLDVSQRVRFREIVRQVGQNAVVILSTHIVDDVHDCAERVVAINEGSVRFDGTTQQLMDLGAHGVDPIRTLEANYLGVISQRGAGGLP